MGSEPLIERDVDHEEEGAVRQSCSGGGCRAGPAESESVSAASPCGDLVGVHLEDQLLVNIHHLAGGAALLQAHCCIHACSCWRPMSCAVAKRQATYPLARGVFAERYAL